MINALRESASLFSRYYLNEDFNDVRFDFLLRDDIKIGSSFTYVVVNFITFQNCYDNSLNNRKFLLHSVTLLITNVSSETEYDIKASLRVDAMLYTGRLKAQIKKEVFEIKIAPESGIDIFISCRLVIKKLHTHTHTHRI